MTDADIIFEKNTLFELVKYFKDKKIGLVDSCIKVNSNCNKNEEEYWKYETELKRNESLVYGKINGPSGGCYAIRQELFKQIPSNFLVDDFFVGFNVNTQHYNSILNTTAICTEYITSSWKQEFKRKIRISAGNFQNLWYFKKYAINPFSTLGFIFISHKVIRWKTPFLLLILYYVLLLKFTLFILILTLCLPIVDMVLYIFGLKIKPLRQFHYFILMNIAIFLGFIKFLKGVKTNVWKPTLRQLI